MKDEMKNYMNKYIEMWKKERGTFPMVCFDEDLDTNLYFGKIDDEGYIQWTYKEKENIIDFSELEKKYDMILHKDIKEYYNSFCFIEIEGFFKGKSIYLDGVYDEEEIINNLEYSFESEDKDMINIGMINPDSLALYFDNKSGNIIIYDYERNIKKILSKSFSELFNEMTPLNLTL